MRRVLLVLWLVASCLPAAPARPYVPAEPPLGPSPHELTEAPSDPYTTGRLDDHLVGFTFDGGQLELDMYSDGTRVVQTARNHYMVPVVIAWTISPLENLEADGIMHGTAFLPPANAPNGRGPQVVLSVMRRRDIGQRYRRDLEFRARFGDPRARPVDYAYALPYPVGQTFAVLQGFHGEFSHRGSNEYAVDFDCPVATPVLAARPGIVVASHQAAIGSGTTPDYLAYKQVNFVIIQHADGTLGEYMHLSPSSVIVRPGEPVQRHQPIALSGNTGFSTTPHLHFQVMTAASDGIAAISFPFRFSVTPSSAAEPVQGKRYSAWE